MNTIELLLMKRRRAATLGDQHLAAEYTLMLARAGYQETAVSETPFEQAIPAKRGRPRKQAHG